MRVCMNFIMLWTVVLLTGCSYVSQKESLECYDGPMGDSFQSEHIEYTNNVLKIDGSNVELPQGQHLRVEYKTVNGRKSVSVKVDGKELSMGSSTSRPTKPSTATE